VGNVQQTNKKKPAGEKKKPDSELCTICNTSVAKQSLKRHLLKHKKEGQEIVEPAQPTYDDDRYL
jgi:hypothetical protein